MVEALRIREFRLLWFARLISLLGSWLLVVAVPTEVFTLTGSVAAAGVTLAAECLPPLLLGPIAGVLADRWDRRRVMIGTDLARAAAIAVLLLVHDPGDVWLVYAALVAESVGTVLFRPAAQAYTPVVVGTGSALSSANALNAATDGIVRLVGGPLGGALLTWVGFGLLVYADAATYVLSAAILLTATRLVPQPAPENSTLSVPLVVSEAGPQLPVAQPVPEACPQGVAGAESAGAAVAALEGDRAVRRFVRELRDGLGFLRAQRTARDLLLVNTLFLGANACLTTLVVPYGLIVLGGSGATGLLMSALGIGFLLGAPVMRVLVDRVPAAYLIAGALGGTAAGFVALFEATVLVTALPAAVLIGAAGSTVLGGVQTVLQRVTPDALLGRISAQMLTAEAAATLVGALLGPALAQALPIAGVALLAAAATVLSGALAAVLLPRVRPNIAAATR